MASDESFLPQIVGLFYATFDPHLGPVVLHQVPENLITSRSRPEESRSRSRTRPHSRSRSPASSAAALLDFAPISEYVIPKKSLHGKLVTLLSSGRGWDSDEEYRIMGFPAIISDEGGGRYKRNEYMWNLCFVFHASSSLEAFEPVVRKCGRILKSAELDSAYLSAPSADHTPLPAVLEQLFEDLNSYSETSIPLDGFNSLELKLFPFYPLQSSSLRLSLTPARLFAYEAANPSDCEDWHVPIALVDLNELKDDNWDITAARVSQYIDGINHVRRIADLADADPALTRETLRHMLFYQVIMMIDIFQYANMYTLKPSITRLAADETIIAECGSYVTRSGFVPASWPKLLRLYSKLLPGTTVHQWIEANDVLSLGIDPRRFISFGIIKGFLRRVHRWPVRVDHGHLPLFDPPKSTGRKVEFDRFAKSGPSDSALTRSGPGDSSITLRSTETNTSGLSPASASLTRTPPTHHRSPRRPTALTQVKESSFARSLASAGTHPSQTSKREVRQRQEDVYAREKSLVLESYLDGNHHTDEIQIVFRMGWKELEEAIGMRGSKGVRLVYR